MEPPVVPAAETPDAAALPPEEAPGKSEATLARIAQLPAEDQLPAGQWKPGVHYKPIVPAQPTNAPAGKVEVVEVFWYGCSHCYALDPFLESWKRNKPDYIEFVRLPVMWGQPVHRAHARLFYTLQSLGKLDALHTKVFNAIHRDRNLLAGNSDEESYRLQLAFAKANGISESDFKTAYDSFAVDTSLKRAEDLTRRYRVEGVPLLVVNGKYSTDIGMAGGHSQLLQLLNDLAAAEKRR
ncbi:MAG: thiol:disulfide interchange protein DsbA/DsbL [Gammaproteobacteria bacterium]|nr:thiol:disulfide interchange protein DsbA/DsbL [Gammaproteobacteria bacterium]